MQSLLGNTRKIDITFAASGRIDITAHVAKHLQLHRGDVLDVCTDGQEYYLYVKHRAPAAGHHEATVFPTNRSGHNFRTWSRRLCNAILKASGTTDCARLCTGEPIQKSGVILLPIITKYLL